MSYVGAALKIVTNLTPKDAFVPNYVVAPGRTNHWCCRLANSSVLTTRTAPKTLWPSSMDTSPLGDFQNSEFWIVEPSDSIIKLTHWTGINESCIHLTLSNARHSLFQRLDFDRPRRMMASGVGTSCQLWQLRVLTHKVEVPEALSQWNSSSSKTFSNERHNIEKKWNFSSLGPNLPQTAFHRLLPLMWCIWHQFFPPRTRVMRLMQLIKLWKQILISTKTEIARIVFTIQRYLRKESKEVITSQTQWWNFQ